ncbi:serine/threonine protein kinase [Luteolibacter algae]|uniref:Serine/threonine protein kinase n=1 Tax=Luteolibacter algae TaxID=454151 RepID=A0ABW5D972_9BACT
MREPKKGPFEFKQPDPKLLKIYADANRYDEELLDLLCPSFASILEAGKRYTDVEQLGQGALKDVFRTFDTRSRRWVAMARLRKNRGYRFFDPFIHEAWLIAGMNHPNIIKVHDVGVDGGQRPFFTMDLRGNTSLQTLISQEPSYPLAGLLEIFNKICDAISYAHSRGVLHLDLKPQNIQCDSFGEVLVCDWGLGQRTHFEEAEDEGFPSGLSRSVIDEDEHDTQVLGSLGYMAPEQALPNQRKDERTDIYSLGCILHAILTGHPPFEGTTEKVLDDTAHSRVAPLRKRFPAREIPEGLEAVVLKAMALAPGDRYESVRLLQQEIRNYLGGYATAAEEPGFFREMRLFFGRNRLPASIASLALIILTVTCVLFVQYLDREQTATAEERQRANRLLTEVDMISSDYQELFKQSDLTKKELALNLTNSANANMRMSVAHQPVQIVAHALRLVDMALMLDPECVPARRAQFVLNCIKLDHKAALKMGISDQYGALAPMVNLARQFAKFDFDEEKRPTTEQLIAFYHAAAKNKFENSNHLEKVLLYQLESTRLRPTDAPLVEAFFQVVNDRSKKLTLEYTWKNRTAVVSNEGDLKLRIPSGNYKLCVLRYFTLSHLIVNCSGSFKVSDLNLLEIESLDLRGCYNATFDQRIHLLRLNRIYTRKGQISASDVEKFIHSNSSVKIIEDPEL